MTTHRERLAPGVPDWRALGVDDLSALLAGGAPPRGAELVRDDEGLERWRVPLPGTPFADGRRNGAPRGAGTGWMVMLRWTTPRLGDRLRARFTAPASVSLAERAWNLACTLRASGVPCAEPMGVASEASALVARRSVLFSRELEGLLPLDDWLARFGAEADRRELAEALGLFLGRLAASGVCLPDVTWTGLVAHEKSGGRAACALEQIVDQRDRAAVRGIPVSALPELALADVTAGSLGEAADADGRARLAQVFASSVPAAQRATTRDLLRFLRGALGEHASREARHRLARRLAERSAPEVRRGA